MVFSSVISLFAFLPAVFFIYFLIPRRFALAFLFLMNLVFYGWGGPVYLVLMLLSIGLNYGAALLIERCAARHKRRALIAAMGVNLALLGYFKYAGLLAGTAADAARAVSSWFPAADGLASVAFAQGIFAGLSGFAAPELPIGISFYTFQAMAYVVDVYRGDTPAERSALKFGTFISLFPQLIAGPIVLYRDVAERIGRRDVSVQDIESGLKTFICGLSKKLLLANPVERAWAVFARTPGHNGTVGAWVGLVAYAFHIYFDFSGYSDMAVGLGRMLGFKFPDNFNYPYISKSITEFWRRWHITLSTWFRDYLYIPLGGSRRGGARNLLNLFVVWLLTGLWHGASWNFALWGLYFAVLLACERLFLNALFDRLRLPAALRMVYALALVTIGWGLFALTDVASAGGYIAELFGFHAGGTRGAGAGAGLPAVGLLTDAASEVSGGSLPPVSPAVGLFSAEALRQTLAYLPTLAACALAATPLPKRAWAALTANGRRLRAIEAASALALFILCAAAATAQGYNPFIYFRF